MNIMEDFKKGLILVNVRSGKQAVKFILLCCSHGIIWGNGKRDFVTNYEEHRKKTYYRCCDGKYLYFGNVRYPNTLSIHEKIITYDEFEKEYFKKY